MKMKCYDCQAVFAAAEYCPECGSNGCHETVETNVFAEMKDLESQMLALSAEYVNALTDKSIPLKERWQAYVDAPKAIHKHDEYVYSGYDEFCKKVFGQSMMDEFYYGNRYQTFYCVEAILDDLIFYIEDKLEVPEEDVEDHELLVEFRELVLKNRVETCVWDW